MTQKEIDEILKLLQAGKTHEIDHYFSAEYEYVSFGYDKAQKKFFVHKIDTVSGSCNFKNYHTKEEIAAILSKY